MDIMSELSFSCDPFKLLNFNKSYSSIYYKGATIHSDARIAGGDTRLIKIFPLPYGFKS